MLAERLWRFAGTFESQKTTHAAFLKSATSSVDNGRRASKRCRIKRGYDVLIAPLALLFVASGACALVYQVMWLRMLALIFGVTVYAASTVLASFMAGLALGSYLAGRFASRLKSPLLAFGLAEVGIGITTLTTPALLDFAKELWVAAHPSLPESFPLLTAARFAASLAILIVPTTLMGATLPLVMESALVRNRALASRIGLLYAANTGGAILGALFAGFYLVSHVGIATSIRFTAVANVLIGCVAMLLSLRVRPTAGPSAAAEPPDAHPFGTEPGLTLWAQRAVLWSFALSGVASLALELVWFRMLVVFLRPTAYAFTIMLAVVLAGIALGSAVATAALRRQRAWLPVLTIVQGLIAVTTVLSLNALAYLQDVGARLGPGLIALGVNEYVAPIVVTSLLAMLPTTLLLGFAFPIGLSLWAAQVPNAARRIGTFYSLNVLGAILGSIASGFVLLPLLGSRNSLIAIGTLSLFACVMLALTQWRTRPNFAGFVAMVAPVAFVMSALNAVDPFAVANQQMHRNERVLWREEGVQTTVSVHERGSGRHGSRILYLDGMHQADDAPASAFVHHRIGALPVMLHPNPRRALVVGLGGGATPGAVAQFGNVNVDVVELSDAVVGGATFFSHINFDLFRRPNVSMRLDDGRNFLLTTRNKYDVITADIILPRHAGAGALYAREYFQLVRSALAEGGLALQWNGAPTETPYKLIMRTFMSVFPYTTLWGDGSLMLGSLMPFELSAGAYEQRRQDPQFRALFDWDLEVLRRSYVAGHEELREWVGPGDILTDDRPTIEYFLALPKDDPAPNLNGFKPRFDDILRP
jgi:spermidine synthase